MRWLSSANSSLRARTLLRFNFNLKLLMLLPLSDYHRRPRMWLGPRPARGVQAMGQGQRLVHAAARQSVRHVVRLPHGAVVQSEGRGGDVTRVQCSLHRHAGDVHNFPRGVARTDVPPHRADGGEPVPKVTGPVVVSSTVSSPVRPRRTCGNHAEPQQHQVQITIGYGRAIRHGHDSTGCHVRFCSRSCQLRGRQWWHCQCVRRGWPLHRAARACHCHCHCQWA